MRFQPPDHTLITRTHFEHPAFAGYARHRELLACGRWPDLDLLNAELGQIHPHSGAALQFVEQTPKLSGDGLHYEARIFDQGLIATRLQSWHDLFNALVWIEHFDLKATLNSRQHSDIRQFGRRDRTRAQHALTQFDEGGVVVVLRDRALLDQWDRHQWFDLFWAQRKDWIDNIRLTVIGHTLLEHALLPRQFMVAKSLVVIEPDLDVAAAMGAVHARITDQTLLCDPLELRPLPLSGIPGWHPDNAIQSFHETAGCYAPLRPGRSYPEPTSA